MRNAPHKIRSARVPGYSGRYLRSRLARLVSVFGVRCSKLFLDKAEKVQVHNEASSRIMTREFAWDSLRLGGALCPRHPPWRGVLNLQLHPVQLAASFVTGGFEGGVQGCAGAPSERRASAMRNLA